MYPAHVVARLEDDGREQDEHEELRVELDDRLQSLQLGEESNEGPHNSAEQDGGTCFVKDLPFAL